VWIEVAQSSILFFFSLIRRGEFEFEFNKGDPTSKPIKFITTKI
jgi:hypothetical protein